MHNTSSDILSIVIDSTFQLYLASGQVVAPTCPAGNRDVEMSTNQILYTTLSEATFTFQTSALLLRCSGDTAQQVILISSVTGMYCDTSSVLLCLHTTYYTHDDYIYFILSS